MAGYKPYMSESLKDGFQHVLTHIVVERPNIEFPGAFGFLQVLCLGCKSEQQWATIIKCNSPNSQSILSPVLLCHSRLHDDGNTKQLLSTYSHCLQTEEQAHGPETFTRGKFSHLNRQKLDQLASFSSPPPSLCTDYSTESGESLAHTRNLT